jgi:pilus assembly protein Flp/PilA
MLRIAKKVLAAGRKFVTGKEEGVTAIEYALLAALIAVAIITSVQFLAGKISGTFNTVGGAMP